MSLVELGEIVTIKGGGTPDKKVEEYWNGKIKWATVKDFKSTRIADTVDRITKAGVENSATNIIPAGTIVVPTRMAVGKVAVLADDMAINQDLKALFHDHRIHKRYLFHYLLANGHQLERQATGATVKGIKLEVLKSLRIPLPPLEEQQRIAAILDQADAIVKKRQAALDKLGALGQSIFYDMFGDPSEWRDKWPMGTIRDLIETAKYGTSKKANTNTDGIPVLRMGNITYDGELDLTDLKHVELSDDEYVKYGALKDDILFNRTNSKELVGKTTVFDVDERMAIAGYIVRARVNEKADPYFISGYLNSRHGKQTLANMCKNIVGMANINAQELQDIKIAQPPISLQIEFRKKLDDVKEKFPELETSLSKSELLFSSLQQRAFRGGL